MKRKRASGLLPIRRSTASAVSSRAGSATSTRSRVRLRRVHRGLLELRGKHFAEALEAPDVDLAATVEGGGHQLVLVQVVARVERLAALRQPIERRHGEIEVPLVDELRHLAGRRKSSAARRCGRRRRRRRVIMMTLLVAQVLIAVVRAGAAAERLDEVGKLLVLRQLVANRRSRRSGSCRATAARPGSAGCAPAWPSRRPNRPRR